MALSLAQRSIIEKSKASGTGDINTALDDSACVYTVATIVNDLGLQQHFKEFDHIQFPDFYTEPDPHKLKIPDLPFLPLVDRLFNMVPDSDTYFNCLAKLQKSRLKYHKILECQPLPTMDQVGPRALLQFGQMPPKSLAGFLFWRKWLFDIDNRAGQETGYLFEPILAHAIGGAPFSHSKSPIRRAGDSKKGRQVDCIKVNLAYEFKIRVTIASSGQGRWGEELDFPKDCTDSGYKPMLVVLDPTPNPKLEELANAFGKEGGEVFIGVDAWRHLEEAAGDTMSRFIEKYVRKPLQEILSSAPSTVMPELNLQMQSDAFIISVDGEVKSYPRRPESMACEMIADEQEMPNDIDSESPGLL